MADIQLIQCKINRKRPRIAEIIVPCKEIGVNVSNDDVSTLTGSS